MRWLGINATCSIFLLRGLQWRALQVVCGALMRDKTHGEKMTYYHLFWGANYDLMA